MARKKSDNNKMAVVFIAGFVAALIFVGLWGYATYSRVQYPNSYMMPMMRMMVGNARSIDCSQLSEADFEKIGEDIMDQMMGEELHEEMDEQMRNETAMHILMGKMMTGCDEGCLAEIKNECG
jgi:uncharacterized protein (UPF0305 family)